MRFGSSSDAFQAAVRQVVQRSTRHAYQTWYASRTGGLTFSFGLVKESIYTSTRRVVCVEESMQPRVYTASPQVRRFFSQFGCVGVSALVANKRAMGFESPFLPIKEFELEERSITNLHAGLLTNTRHECRCGST